jgi:hypothetical protein
MNFQYNPSPWETNPFSNAGQQPMDFGMAGIPLSGTSGGGGFNFSNPFGNMSNQDIMGFGKGAVDIFGGLYGMYNQNKGLGLAKDQMNMQKNAYNDNRNARNSFVNTTRQAFGAPNQL